MNSLTAIISALTAAVALIAAILAVWRSLKKDLNTIHLLVNSNLSSVVQRVEQLTTEMTKKGVEVPPTIPPIK